MKKYSLCTECDERLQHLVSQDLISEKQHTILKDPERVVSGQLHITRDDGSFESLDAFRIQHSLRRGPGKGGIRFHQDVNAQEVSGLAFVMSLKTSLLDIPYGGAKGGVQFDPKGYSESEIESVSRAYVQRFSDVLGPQRDIPAPDVNTTPQIMKWMQDEYEQITGLDAPGFITGKPVEDGGSEGRNEATGAGAFMIMRDHFKDSDISGLTVAIQGFGNAGAQLAGLLSEEGYKVVAVSDSKGAIYNKEGLDIDAVSTHKKERKPLHDMDEVEKISNEELLELEVDILVPAALGDVITKKNAKAIQAKTIVEVANQPITPEADTILNENDVTVLPDLLVNAGGVTVSYFEWYQNVHDEKWTRDDVMKKLQKKMSQAYKETAEMVSEKDITFRDAAYTIAIDRIIKE